VLPPAVDDLDKDAMGALSERLRDAARVTVTTISVGGGITLSSTR
jgi:hypothetical protein